MTFEEMKNLSEEEQKKLYNKISDARSSGKTAGYACVYGAGPTKLALTLKKSKAFAEKLHKGYWKLNWAVKKLAEDQTVKDIGGQLWLLNPLNGFYYSLRYKKDIFSTLCQGSGTYCFDLWVENIMKQRPQINGQFHDEVVLEILDNDLQKDQINKILKSSIDSVNKQLNLNVDLDVDVQLDYNYGGIH